MKNRRERILHEPLGSLMLRMSVPGIAAMILVSANAFVDAVFVGRMVGPDALAGISIIIPFFVVNNAVISLIAGGSASLFSRAIGADDEPVLRHLFRHVLLLALGGSLLLSVGGWFFGARLISFMEAGESISRYAAAYYKPMMAGCVFSVVGLCASGLVRAEGSLNYSIKVTGATVVANFLLNPLFINVFHWGVEGSAAATIVSMAVYCVMNIQFLVRKRTTSMRGAIDPSIIKDILSVGLSAMLLQVNAFVRQLILFRLLAQYGNEQQTVFFSAVYRIFSFCVVPVFGILQALQPVIGMNYGAHHYNRCLEALKVFRRGAVLLMFLPAVFFSLFPQTILTLLLPSESFSPADAWNFRTILILLPMAPVASTAIVFLQATGTRKLSVLLTAGKELFLFIPLIFLFTYLYGADGIYRSLLVEAVLYTVVMLWIMHRQAAKLRTMETVQETGALATT